MGRSTDAASGPHRGSRSTTAPSFETKALPQSIDLELVFLPKESCTHTGWGVDRVADLPFFFPIHLVF